MTEPIESTGEDPLESLILDLLEYVASRSRSYDETMSAWRTSCPRLPVWEDAYDHGLIVVEPVSGSSVVRITPEGLTLLRGRRPSRSLKD
jgi:D-3-phosphoglycerate dehydrogenase